MADDERERGHAARFEVRDRRRFDASGEARAGETDSAAGATTSAAPAAAFESDDIATFSTFLLGLSTQALLLLGEIANPVSGAIERDLVAAKQVIDLVGVLEVKTRGNLDAEERRFLESVLYDLRMRYVENARKQQPT